LWPTESGEDFSKDHQVNEQEWRQRRPLLFGAVQGGVDSAPRRRTARETSAHPDIEGFLLDGFDGGPGAPPPDSAAVLRTLATDVLPHLSGESKPRVYLGSAPPPLVLDLISLGVDVFDSSYVNRLSEQGVALTFNFNVPNSSTEQVNGDQIRNGLEEKLPATMKLSNEDFRDDFSPLVPDCLCYVCSKHSRAYINHLLATKELLGPTLLAMHNMYHYQGFFASIRAAIDAGNGAFEELKSHIQEQWMNHK